MPMIGEAAGRDKGESRVAFVRRCQMTGACRELCALGSRSDQAQEDGMEQRLSLVTLGVSDLARACRFYEDVLGWRRGGGVEGAVAFYQLGGKIGRATV